jgi:hypothetical protein
VDSAAPENKFYAPLRELLEIAFPGSVYHIDVDYYDPPQFMRVMPKLNVHIKFVRPKTATADIHAISSQIEESLAGVLHVQGIHIDFAYIKGDEHYKVAVECVSFQRIEHVTNILYHKLREKYVDLFNQELEDLLNEQSSSTKA